MSVVGSIRVDFQGSLWNGQAAEQLVARLRIAMRASCERVVATAARETPVNTGALRASIASEVLEEPSKVAGGAATRGLPGRIVGRVGSPLGYARYVEEGRRPGRMPPRAPIEAWVRRKLGPSLRTPSSRGRRRGAPAQREAQIKRLTFLVRRSIGRRGLKPRRMLARALEREDDWIQRAFRAAVRPFATGGA